MIKRHPISPGWFFMVQPLACATTLFFLGGCGGFLYGRQPDPTIHPFSISTLAASTIAAVLTESTPGPTPFSPTVTEPPILPSSTPGIPTANFFPVITITVLPTQSATPPYSVGTGCDRAEFIKDVSIPDNSAFPPGTAFVKTWRLRNAGTCSWGSGYRVVFDGGNALGAAPSISLPSEVIPGSSVDIAISFRTPTENQTYQGNWILQNAQGVKFGVGINGDKPFWVRIRVAPPFFAVTGANAVVDNPNVTGPCPHIFNFAASLTASTTGVVTYRWERSDNKEDSLKTLQFLEPGTQTLTTTWAVGTPGKPGTRTSGWVRLYVDLPNHQAFGQADFILVCTN